MFVKHSGCGIEGYGLSTSTVTSTTEFGMCLDCDRKIKEVELCR